MPGTPGTHGGAIGAPRVLGLGHPGIGIGGVAFGVARVVQHRRRDLDGRVELGAHTGRIAADRSRNQDARRHEQRRCVFQ